METLTHQVQRVAEDLGLDATALQEIIGSESREMAWRKLRGLRKWTLRDLQRICRATGARIEVAES